MYEALKGRLDFTTDDENIDSQQFMHHRSPMGIAAAPPPTAWRWRPWSRPATRVGTTSKRVPTPSSRPKGCKPQQAALDTRGETTCDYESTDTARRRRYPDPLGVRSH